MGYKKTGFGFVILIWLVFTGWNLPAQDRTTTPDGNKLPRASFYNGRPVSPESSSNQDQHGKAELPCNTPGELIVNHVGYTISYNVSHLQANWVAYELTADETHSRVKRNNRFIPDPLISEGSASNDDYKNSGFDRGHLAPSADMCYSEVTMKESFYLSNMSPQKPGFNRGIWKNLEEQVRQWALKEHNLYIVTGGVLTNDLPTTGVHHVSVPGFFYKAVVVSHDSIQKGIGFVIPNDKSGEKLQHYVVSIDSLERLTGFDFYCSLPDQNEEVIENRSDTLLWQWIADPKKNGETEND